MSMAQPATSTRKPQAVAHRLVVKLRQPSDAMTALSPLAARYGIVSVTSWLDPRVLGHRSERTYKSTASGRSIQMLERGLERIMVVEFSSEDAPEEVAAKITTLPGVEYAEPLYVRHLAYIPNDPSVSQQPYLQQIRALEGWDLVRADTSIIIAILDTGVDLDHPDLRSAIWTNPGETGRDAKGRDRRNNGIDDDGNGLVDDWTGYDFGGSDGHSPDNLPQAAYFHGTHVAGLAAAAGNNNTGIAGVGFGAKLLAVKISDDETIGQPLLTGGFTGIKYAVDMGARIINCSWGGPGYSRAEQDLVDYATEMGSLIVASAGNESSDLPVYPASYQGVLSVASVMSSDSRSFFSNFNTSVGISAPGNDIYSTMPTARSATGYGTSSGTSMAAPIVSGAAALVATRYPELSAEQIAGVLRASSDNIDAENPGFRYLLGSGRLNIARAVTVGPNAVSAVVAGYEILEEHADSIIEPAEGLEIRVTVKNLLRQTSALTAELTSDDPTVQIVTPDETFGTMGSGDMRRSDPGVFRLVAPNVTTLDYPLTLRVTLREGDTVIGVRSIDLVINPNYSTTSYNRVRATFTGNGRIGFNDPPNNSQGYGLQFDSSGTLLAEGGMLIGVSAGRLFDVVRTGNGAQSNGLRAIEPYRVTFSAQENAQIGAARFTDTLPFGSDAQRIHTDIRLKTIEYKGSDQENQVLALYTITNTGSQPLDNIYCALYLDWDLGPGGADNQAEFDPEHRLGYTRNVSASSYPVTGVMLLSEQPMNFSALDNNGAILGDGFTQEEKWKLISGGIQRERSNVGDCSMVIGAGPIALAPGRDTVVTFSLMAGETLADLQKSSERAKELYKGLGQTPGEPIMLIRQLDLRAGIPNPFSDHTQIRFQLPANGSVTLDVYDPLGKRVATLASGEYQKGSYAVTFKPESTADGVYLVRLTALGQTLTKKLLYMK
jgi:subtilisin family serine protease